MTDGPQEILILDSRIDRESLRRLVQNGLEFTSLINISPARGNRGMEISDAVLCERIRSLALALVGEGEAL